MIKKYIKLLLIIFIVLAFGACGEIEETPNNPNINIGGTPGNNPDKNNPDNPGGEDHIHEFIEGECECGEKDPNYGGITPPDNTEVEFTVSLVYNKQIFIPSETITVYWIDDYSQYKQTINSDGYAKIMLDGDFSVYLDKAPEGYSYNPNIYTSDNDNPTIEIELLKIAKIRKGKGTALFDEYEISSEGTYRSEVKSKTQKVFYEFQPKKAGYYIIQSLVNIHEDTINPKIDTYTGTSVGAKYYSETIDSGGDYKKGGYTKNFQWIVRLTEDMIQSVFTFALIAEVKTNVYPVNVDFKITYAGEYIIDPTLSKMIVAEQAGFKTDEYPGLKYYNADGGTGSYYTAKTNGSGLLEGDMFEYNPETGFYHFYNRETKEFGAILCAAIATPCAFYEESLNMIESHGNKNLTVSDGTENYKNFIEISYTLACNSDGVCYVTPELKEFLQKFSISQRLFIDGNGFCESQSGVFALEDDQWLFACGYYA